MYDISFDLYKADIDMAKQTKIDNLIIERGGSICFLKYLQDKDISVLEKEMHDLFANSNKEKDIFYLLHEVPNLYEKYIQFF